MIEIREEKLRELLESRKKYIGGTDFPIDGLFADIAFLLSILVTDYKPVLSIPAKEVKLFFLACIYCVYIDFGYEKLLGHS